MITGKCLCGGVRFELRGDVGDAHLCHCKMCRRWGGGMPLVVCGGEVHLLADETLKWWKSSPWGERGFCGVCGSSLFWRTQDGGHFIANVGALDDDNAITTIGEHIYIDEKPAFYQTADDAPRLSGAAFAARVMTQLSAKHGEGFLPEAMRQMRQTNGDAFADEVERLMAERA